MIIVQWSMIMHNSDILETEVTADFFWNIAFILVTANFLREKYISKINAKETK